MVAPGVCTITRLLAAMLVHVYACMCCWCILQGTAAVVRAATLLANGDTELKSVLSATLKLQPEHRESLGCLAGFRVSRLGSGALLPLIPQS